MSKVTLAPNGRFRTIVFSCMHLGEKGGQRQDDLTFSYYQKVLDACKPKPDYIVFGGDIVTGKDVGSSEEGLDSHLRPFLNHCNTPFSFAFGTRDNTPYTRRTDIFNYLSTNYGRYSHTRLDAGPSPYRNGNHNVLVYEDEHSKEPSKIMWFLDSGGCTPRVNGSMDVEPSVSPDVSAWIQAETYAMKSKWGSLPQSLVFVHRPFSIMDNKSILEEEARGRNSGFDGDLKMQNVGGDIVLDTLKSDLGFSKGDMLLFSSGQLHVEDRGAERGLSRSGIPQSIGGNKNMTLTRRSGGTPDLDPNTTPCAVRIIDVSDAVVDSWSMLLPRRMERWG
ncbi:MAG: hypothetical protein TREMPRED_003891 [Tremellales sp. Tagirdzhanova-0007]|nr:MAG: hypothetical protein TREMPRED_003891 [Tremellales sp. Tagirdzhanova-0007]